MERSRAFRRPYPAKASTPRNNSNRIAIGLSRLYRCDPHCTDQRERIKAAFQASPAVAPVRILLATDAASEGIDLQNHCARLIHSEIPWNPNRMEQRNGRINRHGQRAATVQIFHFVSKGWNQIGRKDAEAQREATGADLRAFAAWREPSVESEIARKGAKPQREEKLSAFAALRETLDRIGETYHTHRQSIMLARQEGLTKTYNRFHNPSETAADIAELRRLPVEMDNVVAAAYGWNPSTSSGHALDLGHGFHETKKGYATPSARQRGGRCWIGCWR